MVPHAHSMFVLSLAMGTTIVSFSHHWLIAWIGLEINTLAIIPIMMKTPHPRAIEAATKYFLTQATASAMILFSALMNAWITGQWFTATLSDTMSIIILIAFMMKMGLAPVHLWMPEVLQGIHLTTGLVLSTWQKIAPMILLVQMSQHANIFLTTLTGLFSILIGGWGGINQTQTRKIMAFSSIGHLGWMFLILKFKPQLAWLSFILYVIMTTAMFLALISVQATKMTDISTSWSKTPALTSLSLIFLLSLAGLPPLTGFIPKLLIIMELVKQSATILATTALLASLLALFFYIRLTHMSVMLISPNTSYMFCLWQLTSKSNPVTALSGSATVMGLPVTPLLLM